jgi:hypothetical protein
MTAVGLLIFPPASDGLGWVQSRVCNFAIGLGSYVPVFFARKEQPVLPCPIIENFRMVGDKNQLSLALFNSIFGSQ